MRLLISAAATLALAVALLSACKPHDTSAPTSNSSASNAAASKASATDASLTNPATAQSSANVPAATQQAAAPNDDVARIKQDELTAGLKKGSVVLYDVRDKASYAAGHIRGAKNVPWDEVEKRLSEFPKDKQIVTYCA
jgi:ABC-type Fe2+-enterobactin transport system substrate-binding protein